MYFIFVLEIRAWGETSEEGENKSKVKSSSDGCDHTSTKAQDPIITPQLRHAWMRVVLGWWPPGKSLLGGHLNYLSIPNDGIRIGVRMRKLRAFSCGTWIRVPINLRDALKAIYGDFISLCRINIGWDLRTLYLYRRLEHGGKQAKRERARVKWSRRGTGAIISTLRHRIPSELRS